MKKKGAALLVVIIIMMLTFLLATIMLETSIKHLRVSSDTVESTKAYYCAETGVYDAINYIELMAAAGTFDTTYYAYDIPINNLYSLGENGVSGKSYLFGDSTATYMASIRLNSIVNLTNPDVTQRQYTCTIYSKGTYNNQNYLINDTVAISYTSGRWNYSFNSKLSTKD